MLKFGNKEFRNLQEQVLKNMQDIQDIMQGTTVLAEFGIKVIGQVDTAAELPDPATYEGEYGDAYVVGTEEPYEYYIFTRAFEGQEEPTWFDLGIFPVPGPQGETGPQGPVGPQGPTGPTGSDGAAAGFGTISASAQTLVPGSSATATVVASGPNASKNFTFTFGIPQGEQGSAAECVWGLISGDLANQTDLANALQAKQDSLVSGTNIKTINNESILGSGDLTITAGVSDVEVNGVSVVDEDGVAAITVPTNYVTIDTTQTINGSKTFANPVEFTTMDVTFGSGTVTTIPGTIRTDKTNSYGVNIPSTSAFAANKTLATTDQIPSLTGYATETWVTNQGYAVASNLATVATSGSYDDLLDKPSIPAAQVQADWAEEDSDEVDYIQNKPTLAAVATSGDYDDLLNKPTIPAAQVNSDWNAASGVAQILNKPNLATVATSGSYADLSNKPTIPTATSDLNNDSGFITSSAIPVTDVTVDGTSVVSSKVASITLPTMTLSETAAATPDYTLASITIDGDSWNLPSGISDVEVDGVSVVTSGVAEIDLSGYATTSDISDMATETWVGNQGYLTSVSWNDVSSKPTFATVATTGDYDDLLNKPTIPTVPVQDVTVDGVSVVSSGTAAITMPTIPTSLPIETLTTEPSAAYTGPGLKLVYLSAEPTAKYAGYIYMIAES